MAAGTRNSIRQCSHPQSPAARVSVEIALSPTAGRKHQRLDARQSSIDAKPDEEEPTQGRRPGHDSPRDCHHWQAVDERKLRWRAAPEVHQFVGQNEREED